MSNDTANFIGFLMLLLVIICLFLVAEQRDELKEEAVKRGFAEWVVIGQNNTVFKMKESAIKENK
jgi:hypothetical protein